jgi:hypothetical protein
MLQRSVPAFITFVVGAVLVVSFFIPHKPFGQLGEDFSVFFDIISVFAFFLGGGNLLRIHLEKVSRRGPGWGYSVVTLVAFVVTLALGFSKWGNPWGVQGDLSEAGSPFNIIYEFIFTPLSATMFALLAFYVASASYRAFRAKNAEATVLLVAAFVILLGRTFLGALVTAWVPEQLAFLRVPELANWILAAPNLSGQRAIMIGIERSYLGADGD